MRDWSEYFQKLCSFFFNYKLPPHKISSKSAVWYLLQQHVNKIKTSLRMRECSDNFHKLYSSFLNYDSPPHKISNKSTVPIYYLLQPRVCTIKKFYTMQRWQDCFKKLYRSFLNDDQPPRKISSQSDKYKLSYRVTRNVQSLSRLTFVHSLCSLAQIITILNG